MQPSDIITSERNNDIFNAQVQNVRGLNAAMKQLNRTVNDSLRKGNDLSLNTYTKVLVLLFCAWSESTFSKLVHTPNGFSTEEKNQIRNEYRSSLEDGWHKCIELGLRKVSSNPERSNYLPNIRRRLSRILDEYMVAPRIVRNKIAHGQWVNALNRENTKINNQVTFSIQNLDAVVITKWFTVYRYLSDMVEILIESPDKAFHRDYWIIIGELEDYLEKTKNWNVDTKRKLLNKKPTKEQKN